MSKITVTIVVVFVFLFGVILGNGFASKGAIEKSTPEVVYKQVDLTDWKRLKEVDDKLLTLSGEQFGLVSELALASSELDVARMEEINKRMEAKNLEFDKPISERQQLLKKLGY